MKHLQLFEDFSSAPAGAQQIAKMLQEATKNFNFGHFTDWDEEKIKDAFLLIKTKPEFLAVNKAIREAYKKIELSGGEKIEYEKMDGMKGKTGYVVNDPDFDWLYEIYWIGFEEGFGILPIPGQNYGKDETYGKEIINHLVNSKIVDPKAPLRDEWSPFTQFGKVSDDRRNGDWGYAQRMY